MKKSKKAGDAKRLLKGIVVAALVITFAPAIKIALLCAVQVLNYVPNIP